MEKIRIFLHCRKNAFPVVVWCNFPTGKGVARYRVPHITVLLENDCKHQQVIRNSFCIRQIQLTHLIAVVNIAVANLVGCSSGHLCLRVGTSFPEVIFVRFDDSDIFLLVVDFVVEVDVLQFSIAWCRLILP